MENKFLRAISTKDAYTDNGALTNSTSLNKCLDFFFVAGDHKDNLEAFIGAYAENPTLALKILFWSRDCRGGAGARKTFQSAMRYLQIHQADVFYGNMLYKYIPFFGYWKDVFQLHISDNLVRFVISALYAEHNALVAKYCPRKGPWFNAIREILKISPKELRKHLVNSTNVVEQKMCANKWNEIDYSKVPSLASNMYRKAFINQDGERYFKYIKSIQEGKSKINANVLYPHQLYKSYNIAEWDYNSYGRSRDRDLKYSLILDSIKAQWEALPNYMEGSNERIIPVCDVSGSMTGTPMEISIALGCYISERNEGPFKDAFLTFSNTPQLNYLQGDILQRFEQLKLADWGFDTNLQAVFDLILERALKCNISDNEMPTKILIISDMEFNEATSENEETNFDKIKEKYSKSGYKMPEIIFWNVNGKLGNVPVTKDEANVGLVSGYSPSLLKSILKGEVLSPIQLMLDTVDTERYNAISAL